MSGTDSDSNQETATSTGNGSWKRKKTWLKNVKKRIRNSAEVKKDPYIACLHGITGACQAGSLSQEDINSRGAKRVKRRKYRKLALFSDSCAGQNKNGRMIAFLLRYVNSKLNVFQDVCFTFPIRGHSYMPPDRVFGRVEKEIRKKEAISLPEGYYDILQRHGHVYKFGGKWNVYDFKSLSDQSLKSTKNLDMRNNRVWMFRKKSMLVSVSNTYSGNKQDHDLLKIHVTALCCKELVKLPPRTHVTEAKRTDVMTLLSFVDLTPAEYTFYDNQLATVCPPKKGIVERPIAQDEEMNVEVEKPKRGRPRKQEK